MKVMWIVNTIFPKPASELGLQKSVFGGWLLGLFDELKKSKKIDQFVIVSTYNCDKLLRFVDGNIIYYLVPCKNSIKYYSDQQKYWKEIVQTENPDVVHIHGTEYPHSLCFLDACGGDNVCVSIQGLVSAYSSKYAYYAGISKFPITFRDFVRFDSVYQGRKKFQNRAIYEVDVLKKAKIIIGRTNWDKAHVYSITNKDNYEKCNESLRKSFYEKKWNIDSIERHSIFVSQATYPIKGFHKVIEAACILKKRYSDLKIYVAGSPITKTETIKDKLRITGYGKYLNSLIEKNNLQDNIIFTGLLDEEQMRDRLLKSHVFVQASSIENSPNSLGEAMLLGMPCVASYVGGTADMLLDKCEGFLYPFNESEMLASYVMQLFENDELAIKFGESARSHAFKTHDVRKNASRMIEIYEKLI